MEKLVTVWLSEHNGRFHLSDAGGAHAVQFPESEWREYRDHLEQCQRWQDFLGTLAR